MKLKIYTEYTLTDNESNEVKYNSTTENEANSVDRLKALLDTHEESLGKLERKIEKELVVEVVSDVIPSPIKL